MNLRHFISASVCVLFAASLYAAAPADTSPPGPAEPITVAVFDFSIAPGSGPRDTGQQIAAIVGARLSADPRFVTVERAELKEILSEHELNLSGAISPESTARIGQLTGAKVLVTGRVFSADRSLLVVAKVMGTETGRVYGELVEGTPGASVASLAADLEQKIADDLVSKGDTLLAKAATPEERIEKLKDSLRGKKLPTVAVHITERSLTRRAIDPAAETEFGLVLQQCGFTVVDDASAQKPEVDISGEAFSSFGMRRGNLVSCEARVEIKVRDTAQGTIKAIDRQTGTAVGLDDPTTEKAALDDAALALAERVLPKITE